jgi:hypothetical protein
MKIQLDPARAANSASRLTMEAVIDGGIVREIEKD